MAKPVVMGILNATPDSFYTGNTNSDALLSLAENMLNDGATILDIGGASTKPGQPLISAEDELQRILPVIEAINKRFPDVWMSVDTYNAEVAKQAVSAGVAIVNHVSGARFDKEMLEIGRAHV